MVRIPKPEQHSEATPQHGVALKPVVRVPWPKDKAPIRIKAKCPICGAGLLLDAGEALEQDDSGEWVASEIRLDCENEPDIDSEEWEEWFNWHYSMPYVDWLPLEQQILRAVQRRFRFAP